MTKVKYKHIHSRYVKRRLEELGHKVVYEERNKKNLKFWIYIFEETQGLLTDLTMITDEINQDK